MREKSRAASEQSPLPRHNGRHTPRFTPVGSHGSPEGKPPEAEMMDFTDEFNLLDSENVFKKYLELPSGRHGVSVSMTNEDLVTTDCGQPTSHTRQYFECCL